MEKLGTTELVPGSLLEKRHSQLKQLPCSSVAPDFRSFLSRHPLPSHGRRYGRLPGVPGRPQPLRLLPPRLPPQQKATPSTRWRPLRASRGRSSFTVRRSRWPGDGAWRQRLAQPSPRGRRWPLSGRARPALGVSLPGHS